MVQANHISPWVPAEGASQTPLKEPSPSSSSSSKSSFFIFERHSWASGASRLNLVMFLNVEAYSKKNGHLFGCKISTFFEDHHTGPKNQFGGRFGAKMASQDPSPENHFSGSNFDFALSWKIAPLPCENHIFGFLRGLKTGHFGIPKSIKKHGFSETCLETWFKRFSAPK